MFQITCNIPGNDCYLNYMCRVNFLNFSNVIENKNIQFVSVNLLDETLLPESTDKVELGNIDYSGINSSGQRVMGLAHLDRETYKFMPDPVLSWKTPDGWTLEDAATIPHAYVSVR